MSEAEVNGVTPSAPNHSSVNVLETTLKIVHQRNTSPNPHPARKISLGDDSFNENALPRVYSLNHRSSRRDQRLRKVANEPIGRLFSNILHNRSGFSELHLLMSDKCEQ